MDAPWAVSVPEIAFLVGFETSDEILYVISRLMRFDQDCITISQPFDRSSALNAIHWTYKEFLLKSSGIFAAMQGGCTQK